MKFQPIAVAHLLDKRLQEARLELLEDRRISTIPDTQEGDSVAFVRTLVEEKLSTAARRSFEAVEATLRVQAAEFLTRHEMGAERQRSVLHEAAAQLLTEDAAQREVDDGPDFRPTAVAAWLLVAWALFALIWGYSADLGALIVLALIVSGGMAATLLRRFLVAESARRKKRLASELPARLCRLYQQELEMAVRAYAAVLNRAVDGPD
ncbi:MAG: hypothetical protein HYV27_23830 [Candidatus Hydrogenedentes bacterium]|nr:hypothetical protein [Candidatus Hydrogenedentota bacterium]